ncbi:DUF6707 family protein [Streptococcus oralis]|uniref:Uncharacterized protein n=1 Tax=Streptococcus oralis subsp. tigurinus TaxID=1077464 RepID=A0A1X0WRI0_STROR|nr:DUF6707 family protein [Streptococcus oralis]ORJ29344.1 hypothetical protein ATE34_04305 [Streptococcus oralis subsp. tigurinus]
MKLTEVFELVENHPDLKPYVEKILKKYKKTNCSYLESLNHLAYLLYLYGQKELAKKLLDIVLQIPFEGDYNSWTFVESSIVLLAYMEKQTENQVSIYQNLLLSPQDSGEESTRKIRRRVHQRFLNGDTLEQKLAKIEQASTFTSEIEWRLLYLADLLKLQLFSAESTLDEADIQSKIEEQIERLQSFIKEQGIVSLFPFKG